MILAANLLLAIVRPGQWTAWTITWKKETGLQVYLNGHDHQLSTTKPVLSPRSYSHICRLVVGRYATDDSSQWEFQGSYGFGRVDFAGLFYLPFAIKLEEIARYHGFLGISTNTVFIYKSTNMKISTKHFLNLVAEPYNPRGYSV